MLDSLLDAGLASGSKEGYVYTLRCQGARSYVVLAFPSSARYGRHLFCAKETGIIRSADTERARKYEVFGDAMNDCDSWDSVD